MKRILETNRLLLRELNTDDAASFYQLNSNPEVIKYTGDKAFSSIEEASLFLENYSDYKTNGYGRWAVIEKETGNFLGWCGLKYNKEENFTDLGFRFFQEHWNKGYATESAQACINFGFENLCLSEIRGRAMKANVASIKVLEKVGMTFHSISKLSGEEAVIYLIKKSKV